MKIRVILPYFGKFNSYFNLWIKSCEQNREIDWLIITDNDIPKNAASNIKFVQMSFQDLRSKFEQKFHQKICLNVPYKLCDYKPYYGYLFSDYLKGYDFWGYCDCDVIWGRIASFLDKAVFQQYDKIIRTGHLSFIRNTEEINTLFLKYNTYRMVISSPVIYGYDEAVQGYHLGFAGELLEHGYRFWNESDNIADVDFRYFPFYVVNEKHISCIFIYDNGRVYKVNHSKEYVQKEEVMYLHLQKRKMTVTQPIDPNRYMICPNKFLPYNESLLSDDTFWMRCSEEKKSYFNFEKEKKNERIRDIKRFWYEPKKFDSLVYRLRNK